MGSLDQGGGRGGTDLVLEKSGAPGPDPLGSATGVHIGVVERSRPASPRKYYHGRGALVLWEPGTSWPSTPNSTCLWGWSRHPSAMGRSVLVRGPPPWDCGWWELGLKWCYCFFPVGFWKARVPGSLLPLGEAAVSVAPSCFFPNLEALGAAVQLRAGDLP